MSRYPMYQYTTLSKKVKKGENFTVKNETKKDEHWTTICSSFLLRCHSLRRNR